jgi:hypothetical protein
MTHPPRRRHDLPPALAAQLNAARDGLLSVHKALLDEERVRYEREVGPVGSAGRLLQLVISDPWFAWLHPLTELVVQIDELVAAKEPAPVGTGEALLEQAVRLLNPSAEGDAFQQRYHLALQASPDVVLAHALATRRMPPMTR